MKTVFLTKMSGKTSNHFFQHVFFDSFCREHNIVFVNLLFHRYYPDYPNLNTNNRNKFKDRLLRSSIWFRRKLKGIEIQNFDDLSQLESYKNFILDNEKTYCRGWFFRNYELTEKYRSLYQHLFDPDVNKEDLNKKYLVRSDADQVIFGVHIRRGDYKEHLNGIYYFEDDVYIKKIQEFVDSLNRGYKIIIFTNDQDLNLEAYKQQFTNVVLSNNPVKEDHYLMSQCDYIMGPESTFSMWASYMGDKPFFHITDPETKVTLDKFRVFKWVPDEQ